MPFRQLKALVEVLADSNLVHDNRGLLFPRREHSWIRLRHACAALLIAVLCGTAIAEQVGDEQAASPPKVSAECRRVGEYLEHLVDACGDLPGGDERCLAILREAFSRAAQRSEAGSPAVLENRAALAAVGILLGEERLRPLAGFGPQQVIPRFPRKYESGATLRGRNDLCRHFVVSAAITALAGPWLGSVAGLAKEQQDADGGSGFSFADLAADRAGVRFARSATRSAADATAFQALVGAGCEIGDVMPEIDGLPEGLSTAELKSTYGAPGSPEYRAFVGQIDERLEGCRLLRERRPELPATEEPVPR